ncbi:MAG: oxidoreductase FAD/NAD(P)-binding domain protein [Phycisphaerales bacterium]|nr:oxidoreductase FAD/NAD(P)-binding domain protein [Phycisphaerales bacterium]
MSVPVLPDSAPFSPEQRAWLNGFFAGIAGSAAPMNGNAMSVAAAPTAALPAPVEDEDFPWHDPALPLDERMAMADGKKPERQLMAAMAQLDCGSCGYLCQTYAEAIASGTDKDTTKCSPGGKETAKKLKELMVTLNVSAGASATGAAVNGSPKPAAPTSTATVSRDTPWAAPMLVSRRLSSHESAKEVRHVEFNLKGSGIDYKVGDALGVWPENCIETVAQIIDRLGATGAEDCHTIDGRDTSLFEALRRERVITRPTESLVELLVETATDREEAKRLQAWLTSDAGEPLNNVDVLDVLMNAQSAKPRINDFVGSLSKLQPRLYSISSSPKAHENQVHLTVGAVRFAGRLGGRMLRGVASTYLADRVRPGEKVRVFTHASKHFGLPPSGDTPMIMVGPGTGIAPFRAFLHDRRATGAKGRNWLFFGDQKRDHDFLYREELESFAGDQFLSRMDIAFSRDQADKVYVQHRISEQGDQLWAWLQDGAHFYVCGDAQRMAKDVDNALKQVVATHGKMSDDDAKAYVTKMTKDGRYQRDVY